MNSDLRNEIKAYIVRQGMTMQEVVDVLADVYGWSGSVSNLSNKLQRESLRYKEASRLPTCWAATFSGSSGLRAADPQRTTPTRQAHVLPGFYFTRSCLWQKPK